MILQFNLDGIEHEIKVPEEVIDQNIPEKQQNIILLNFVQRYFKENNIEYTASDLEKLI